MLIKQTITDEEAQPVSKNKFEPGIYSFAVMDIVLQAEVEPMKWEDVHGDIHGEGDEKYEDCRMRLNVELACGDIGSEFKAYDKIWLTDKGMWKYNQFCASLEMESSVENDTDHFLEKSGRVKMIRRDGKQFLEPQKYLKPNEDLPF